MIDKEAVKLTKEYDEAAERIKQFTLSELTKFLKKLNSYLKSLEKEIEISPNEKSRDTLMSELAMWQARHEIISTIVSRHEKDLNFERRLM